MAVETHDSRGNVSRGRRFLVGTNVAVATALLIAAVVVAQAIAFTAPRRLDMTSSGVNSLSDSSERLLGGLDKSIRLTSLYFETDREDEDQPRYRRAIQDLLALYEATNRSRITTEWVNPLKDHEKYRGLMTRLLEKPAFAEQVKPYREPVQRFTDDLDPRMRKLIQDELTALGALTAAIGESAGTSVLAPIENVFLRWTRMLETTRDRIDALAVGERPDFSAAVNEITALYREFSKSLKDVGKYGVEQAGRNPSLTDGQSDFLKNAGPRYAVLVAELEGQLTALQELEPPKVYDVLDQLSATSNALLVETDEDAAVVTFGEVWSPLDPAGGGRISFKNRAFKGEEKLTSAILRVTHKEQTAAVFVRYGGPPIFIGGMVPGQQAAPYAQMKQHLEDARFVVQEWDLKSSMTPPVVEPTPTRMIFVVMKPTEPQRNPMGQPNPQDVPINETQKQALFDAIGENGRALFLAGWHPGMFGFIPAQYDYNEYLESNWGVKVETELMLIEVHNLKPGQFVVGRRDFMAIRTFDVSDHPIVSSPLARELVMPFCAPLTISDSPPDGVQPERLVSVPQRDDVWGVKNLQAYQSQLDQREYMTLAEGDQTAPFDIAAAAVKGEAKIVVISSRGFAEDQIALAPQVMLTAQGFTLRQANPGNATLLLNSLHWLNDNTQFMNIGTPIDANVLQIDRPETVRLVQVLTIFVWPAAALVFGGVVWWTRRR
jgi:hypothetical protein